jgi:uncharacterized protein YegP (UPF0339 family)
MDELVVQVFHGADGWRWRMRSLGNGEVVASSEAYASKSNAKRAARMLARRTGLAIEVVDA